MNYPLTLRRLFVAGAVVLFLAGIAPAGWICIKNETKATVVLHDVPDGPPGKRGKTVRLLPGEVYREFQSKPGEKPVQLLDTGNPAKVLFEARVKWPEGDVALRIRKEDGEVRLVPVRQKPEGPVAVVVPLAERR